MLQIEKEHKKSSLMSKKKSELVEHIMWLEHNNNVMHDTLNTQADNFIKLTSWIPVVDRLPKAKEDVLICTKSGWILIGWYGPNGQRWHITPADAGITREDIVAWMPLPDPFNSQN